MRRVWFAVLVSSAAVVFPTAALASKHHAKPKPASIKTGTYNVKLPATPPTEAQKFTITLKKATCAAAPGQGKSPLHLCVSVPTSPKLGCTTPVSQEFPLASFVTSVALPASGKLVEHAAVTEPPPIPGGETETGEGTFSVTFTKKGTASGFIEQNLTYSAGSTHGLTCDAKVAFTAKVS